MSTFTRALGEEAGADGSGQAQHTDTRSETSGPTSETSSALAQGSSVFAGLATIASADARARALETEAELTGFNAGQEQISRERETEAITDQYLDQLAAARVRAASLGVDASELTNAQADAERRKNKTVRQRRDARETTIRLLRVRQRSLLRRAKQERIFGTIHGAAEIGKAFIQAMSGAVGGGGAGAGAAGSAASGGASAGGGGA